jgi:hypothetical protein
MQNTQNFNEQDFRTSATETVNYFFEGFSFPSKDSFNESELNHVIDIVASIFMTKYRYRIGGGFVQAVLDNDLFGAFNRADTTMLKAMRIVVYAREYGEVKKFKPSFETI